MEIVTKVQKTTKHFRKTPDLLRILQQNSNRVKLETESREVFVYIQIQNKQTVLPVLALRRHFGALRLGSGARRT